MATLAHLHVPVEVYLRSSYEPDAEYVDGVIEERPMGEYDHASWQEAIILWFWQHAAEWNVRVKPALRVQVAPTRYRVPDITILDRGEPIEQIITHAPVAVFEVLSPEDTMKRMMRKLNDYSAMQIPQICGHRSGDEDLFPLRERRVAQSLHLFSDREGNSLRSVGS